MALRGFSLSGRLAALLVGGTAAALGLTRLGVRWGIPEWRAALLALAVVIPPLVWCAGRLLRPISQTIAALRHNQMLCLRF
jgi:hypothetical protein